MKKQITCVLIGCLSVFSAVYAQTSSEFSYYTVEYSMVDQDLLSGSRESATGPSVRFAKVLSNLVHLRGEFTSLGYDKIALDNKNYELGVGFKLMDKRTSNIYVVISGVRAQYDGSALNTGFIPTGETTAHANFTAGLIGYRKKAGRGVEVILEAKQIQPDVGNVDRQKFEFGVRIHPPNDGSLSLGLRTSINQSDTIDSKDLRLFLRVNY